MKTTVYLNKPTEERFKAIKARNPDYSLSDAIEVGLKFEEERINTQLTGMMEQIAIKGNETPDGFYGVKVKFMGRELATAETKKVGTEAYEFQTLYLTKKGQYVVKKKVIDDISDIVKHDYDICPTVEVLQEKASPILLTKAGRTEGEFLEDLDI